MLQTMYVENASGKSMWKKEGGKYIQRITKIICSSNHLVKERKKERKNFPLSQIANCSDIQVKEQQAH
jgi:hypothetical protein